ncbi:MAG TPA: hypothetical protein VGK56_18360 [Anaerolineales bacterium]
METYELDHSVFQSNKGDESLFVHFYMHFIQDEEKTKEEGRPIFKDTEFVKIFSPGDRSNVIDRPVRPSDTVRFPRQYAAFKNKDNAQAIGTPLDQWPIITRAMAEELKYLGFQTVEQIANARDSVLGTHAGLRDLSHKAKAFIEIAKGNTAPIESMQAELKDAQAQIRARDDALAALTARLDAIEKRPTAIPAESQAVQGTAKTK